MDIHIDKGDWLTFAAAGNACGLDIPFMECEVKPGVWRRHWELKEDESRSDISRDGYLGVLLWAANNPSKDLMSRMIRAGWRRAWTMGDRGEFDYINMWPLVPLMYAVRYGKWFPTLPPLVIKQNSTGFRAHLMALTILVEMSAGKNTWAHRYSTKKLKEANPKNPWFLALYNKAHKQPQHKVYHMLLNFNYDEAAYGWGSCPGEVMLALTLHTLKV